MGNAHYEDFSLIIIVSIFVFIILFFLFSLFSYFFYLCYYILCFYLLCFNLLCFFLFWLIRSRDVKRFVTRFLYLLEIFYTNSKKLVALLLLRSYVSENSWKIHKMKINVLICWSSSLLYMCVSLASMQKEYRKPASPLSTTSTCACSANQTKVSPPFLHVEITPCLPWTTSCAISRTKWSSRFSLSAWLSSSRCKRTVPCVWNVFL